MRPADSVRCIGVLAAYYPRAVFPPETITLWAQSVQKFEVVDVREAAKVLGEGATWTPALSEFLDAIRDCRTVRIRNERTALPAPRPPEYYPMALYLRGHEVEADIVRSFDGTAFRPEKGCGVNVITAALADMLEGEMT